MVDDLTPEALDDALRQHADWLDGRGGRELRLSGTLPPHANLRGVRLAKASLRGANLNGADLTLADLRRADFSGADLSGAKLAEARCQGTSFTDAVMHNTDFTGAAGLKTEQLAGADLTGAVLPATLGAFELLKTVSEASGQAKTMFVTILAACGYSALTIATTKDIPLVTNSVSSPLPVIQTSIPIASFYVVAPLVLVLLFAYFQLLLCRLWEVLACLPAFFPDGAPLDRRAYPWLLIGVVRSHMRLLRSEHLALANFQTAISVLLAYTTVPLTLFAFWLRYLPRHDWLGSALHIAEIAATIGTGWGFYRLSRAGLRREPVELPVYLWALPVSLLLVSELVWTLLSGLSRSGDRAASAIGVPFGRHGVTLVAVLILVMVGAVIDIVRRNAAYSPVRTGVGAILRQTGVALFTIASLGLLTGGSIESLNLRTRNQERPINKSGRRDPRVWVPLMWQRIRFSSYANMTGAEISHKPGADGRGGQPGDLHGLNLAGAQAAGVYAAGANLSGATLWYADLTGANLRDADLSNADLRGAMLSGADLSGANLTGANIAGANFYVTGEAKGLMSVQVRSAMMWQTAVLPLTVQRAAWQFEGDAWVVDEAAARSLKLQHVSWIEKDLRGWILEKSDLRESSFQHTNFTGSNLRGARVFRTDFLHATLTPGQVFGMRGWRMGQYSPRLLARLGLDPKHNDRVWPCHFDGLDLRGADLSGLTLYGCSFSGADLSGAELSGTIFSGGSLAGANLSNAVARTPARAVGADLRGIQWGGGSLGSLFSPCASKLAFADGSAGPGNQPQIMVLAGVNLAGCDLSGLDLYPIDFSGADLTGADLSASRGVRLAHAILKDTNLAETSVIEAADLDQMKQAKNIALARPGNGLIRELSQQDPNFGSASYVGVKLRNADLARAREVRDLTGAELRDCDLTEADFGGTVINRLTLPGSRVAFVNFSAAKIVDERDFADAVREARYWDSAYYSPSLLRILELPPDHNEVLYRVQQVLRAAPFYLNNLR